MFLSHRIGVRSQTFDLWSNRIFKQSKEVFASAKYKKKKIFLIKGQIFSITNLHRNKNPLNFSFKQVKKKSWIEKMSAHPPPSSPKRKKTFNLCMLCEIKVDEIQNTPPKTYSSTAPFAKPPFVCFLDECMTGALTMLCWP